MTKEKAVQAEYRRLKAQFENADPARLELADGLIMKAAHLAIEMRGLEGQIDSCGVIQSNGRGDTRVSIAYRTYLQTISTYSGVIKALGSLLGDGGGEIDDSFDEFMRKAAGNEPSA